MPTQSRQENHLNTDLRGRLKEFSLLIATSVLLALLVSALTSLLLPAPATEGYGRTIEITVISILIIASLYVIWRVIAIKGITRFAWFEVIYNPRDGEILPFMLETTFFPQDMARQAFDSLLAGKPEYRSQLKQNIAQRSAEFFEKSRKGNDLRIEDKHLLSSFAEYLFVRWMAGWIVLVVDAEHKYGLKEKEIGLGEFPPDLKRNTFIDFMVNNEPKDIIERSLGQIKLTVPSDFRLSFEWPRKEARRLVPEPNSGEFKLKGKYCTIRLWFSNSSWMPISSIQSGHYPYLRNIPINDAHLDYVIHKPLYSIGFVAGYEVNFRALSLLFSKKSRGYVDLAEKIGQSFIENFDEGNFLRAAYELRQQRMFNDIGESLASLQGKLDRLTQSHENQKADNDEK